MGVEGASFHGFVHDGSPWNLFWCFLCIFYYRNSPILKTLWQFENLGFVIMSTRENIRLIARAPLKTVWILISWILWSQLIWIYTVFKMWYIKMGSPWYGMKMYMRALHQQPLFCLLWFFTSQSTILQLWCRNGSSWVKPVLSKDWIICIAQGHTTVAPVRLKPTTPRFQV